MGVGRGLGRSIRRLMLSSNGWSLNHPTLQSSLPPEQPKAFQRSPVLSNRLYMQKDDLRFVRAIIIWSDRYRPFPFLQNKGISEGNSILGHPFSSLIYEYRTRERDHVSGTLSLAFSKQHKQPSSETPQIKGVFLGLSTERPTNMAAGTLSGNPAAAWQGSSQGEEAFQQSRGRAARGNLQSPL